MNCANPPGRRRFLLQALAALPLLSLAAGGRAEAAPAAAPSAIGYLPWWMAKGWRAMPLAQLDRLVLFDAPVRGDGRILDRNWPQRAPGLLGHAAHAALRMDIALTVLGEGTFNALFGDSAARARLLSGCQRWIERDFVAGLHLDVEGYEAAKPRATAGFREWLAALDERRRAAGKGLSAFFPASDSFAIYGVEQASGIDYWVAQLYDAHWVDSKVTGPLVTRVAGNPVAVPRALGRLEALGVARSRILLSVPLYGWQWPSAAENPGAAAQGEARLLTFARTPAALMPNDRLAASELARRHGLRRDGEHTPYYAYRDGSHWKQGWYEDLASLTRKFAPERDRGYGGLAFFPLGYDQGEVVEGLLRWWRSPAG